MIIKSEPLVNYKHETYQTIKHALKVSYGTIAGGSAREAFLNEGFGSNDIDVYFPRKYLGNMFFELLHKHIVTSLQILNKSVVTSLTGDNIL